jgi:hypothetical protein
MTAAPAPSAVTPAPLDSVPAPVTPSPAADTAAAAGADVDMVGAAPVAVASAASVMATPNSVVDTPKTKTKKKKKNRKRCHHCKTRVGLTGFECRCSFVFCDKHRYADVHECTYDYAADHRDLLQKLNPRVVASKLDRL